MDFEKKKGRRGCPPSGSTPLGRLRQTTGLAQWRVAELLCVNRSSVCSWEYGRTGITPKHARMLAQLYHTSVEEICRLVDEEQAQFAKY